MLNLNSSENPEFLNDYIMHLKVVKMLAQRTIEEYYMDTRLFLKYICNRTDGANAADISSVDISKMTAEDIRKITVSDIYNFIFFAADERKNLERSRYRKISSLRSFFKYMDRVAHLIDKDPCKELDVRTPKSARPKFLSLDESLRLLEASDSTDSKRDYCIITLFLNCGMRLSELVGINIRDIDFYENRMEVIGKGSKKRTVYLNKACVDAINKYLEVRRSVKAAENEPALFISNQNHRISKRRVQQIVESTLEKAGLDGKGITTHKLRHTAATLMYQYGDADVLQLKELLGHANISTTEIYTHLNDENVRKAVESNPLADISQGKKKR
ncbi:MAG: tyrosine recombinase XerC [Ruminococcus sp.]|nr:tyrosine recombinase XerC [Ruminococcus sp.]HRR75336.1 tyrosine recombinase XerC [Ruminococcus sp.]